MKFFSMFSGIGGFELGINNSWKCREGPRSPECVSRERNMADIQEQSWDRAICVGYSEIDKYAIQIYGKHFGGHKNYGNCTRIKWEDVQDFEMLVGGFPCQAFSMAGKRGGFSDTRGTLFFEIARCLREKQPRLFVLENVKGLLSHDKGNTFLTIITTLDELGYDCQWQVLNSKNFGVPQNRERVFIVGHLRGTSRPEVFPITEESRQSCNEVGTITAINGNDILKRCYSTEGLSPVLNTCGGGNTEGKFLISSSSPLEFGWRENYGALRARDYKDPKLVKTPYKIRRLTPTECERLQGFPDGWTEGISNTQRYKCLGNAVTVNVIEAIMKKF